MIFFKFCNYSEKMFSGKRNIFSNPSLDGSDGNSVSKSYWDTFIREEECVSEREGERERERVNIKSCNITLLPQYRTIKINYCVCSRLAFPGTKEGQGRRGRTTYILSFRPSETHWNFKLFTRQGFYRLNLLHNLSTRRCLLSLLYLSQS